MSWFSELAGRAENLLNNIDEQTGAAFRNNGVKPKKFDKSKLIVKSDQSYPRRRPSTSSNIPTKLSEKRSSPSRKLPPSALSRVQICIKDKRPMIKQSPPKRPSPQPFNLNNSPKSLVNDVDFREEPSEVYGLRHRRHSVPADVEVQNRDSVVYKMLNLEVENTMLKQELSVMNKEISDLLDRLRKSEDELSKVHMQLLKSQEEANHIKQVKDDSFITIQQLHNQVQNLLDGELSKLRQQNQQLQSELADAKAHNRELDERIVDLTETIKTRDTKITQLESDLRHFQSTLVEAQANYDRSKEECQRLEKDWEAYKLRVKNMLAAKDLELQSVQRGVQLNEDTKRLKEQLDSLREERDRLSSDTQKLRDEYDKMQQYLYQLEKRGADSERALSVLREAVRGERAARSKAEGQCGAVYKELRALQQESGQTIASLRSALRATEQELDRAREASLVRSADSSALNVADYNIDRKLEEEKIQRLTQTLVQRQGKIDALLADNNTLRIQLDKLESKYKSEILSLKNTHSVVNLTDTDTRPRPRTKTAPESNMAALSIRMGVFIRRYPIFRIFILVYVVGLHIWVSTVLFSSTPQENLTPLPANIR